jgi:hypothetical protein
MYIIYLCIYLYVYTFFCVYVLYADDSAFLLNSRKEVEQAVPLPFFVLCILCNGFMS